MPGLENLGIGLLAAKLGDAEIGNWGIDCCSEVGRCRDSKLWGFEVGELLLFLIRVMETLRDRVDGNVMAMSRVGIGKERRDSGPCPDRS